MTAAENTSEVIQLKDILDLLPHRYPFLLVDRVIELDAEKEYISVLKNVTANEPFFQGHFPGLPVMPGVLIVEALAQAGAIYSKKTGNDEDKISVLLGVNNAKFRRPVRPGDTLILEGWMGHKGSRGGRFKGKASVDGTVVCEADITFGLADKAQL